MNDGEEGFKGTTCVWKMQEKGLIALCLCGWCRRTMRGKGLRALSLCKLYLKLFSEEKVYADGFVPYLVLVERWSMINFFFFPLCREWVCSKVQIRSAVPTIYWQSTHWATHMKSFHLHHTHRLTATWWVQACWKVSISLDIWVIIGLEHLDMFHADSFLRMLSEHYLGESSRVSGTFQSHACLLLWLYCTRSWKSSKSKGPSWRPATLKDLGRFSLTR